MLQNCPVRRRAPAYSHALHLMIQQASSVPALTGVRKLCRQCLRMRTVCARGSDSDCPMCTCAGMATGRRKALLRRAPHSAVRQMVRATCFSDLDHVLYYVLRCNGCGHALWASIMWMDKLPLVRGAIYTSLMSEGVDACILLLTLRVYFYDTSMILL